MSVKTSESSDKIFFYEGFASEFDATMNMYDTSKRVRIVFDELLPESLSGKLLLDAGCGTGWFSKKAAQRGANVVSLDLGVGLLKETAKKVDSLLVAGTAMNLCFRDHTFDVVVSSEMLEHTSDPRISFRELARVVKPNGLFVLTTPNKVWHFSVVLANALNIRRYKGYENWVGWPDLQTWSIDNRLGVLEMRGFHLFPFQWKLFHTLLTFLDRFGRSSLGKLMINVALKARKN